MSDFRKSLRRNIREQAQIKASKPSNEQAIILSGLNIMQVLEENAPKYLHAVLNYGPNSFIGENWASVLVWYRRKGYQNYKDLTLFGVWVVQENATNTIMVGSKPLRYSAVVYNAESYNTVIKQSFKAYYNDDASVPDVSNITFKTPFDITRRLALRREVADKVIHWLRYRVY